MVSSPRSKRSSLGYARLPEFVISEPDPDDLTQRLPGGAGIARSVGARDRSGTAEGIRDASSGGGPCKTGGFQEAKYNSFNYLQTFSDNLSGSVSGSEQGKSPCKAEAFTRWSESTPFVRPCRGANTPFLRCTSGGPCFAIDRLPGSGCQLPFKTDHAVIYSMRRACNGSSLDARHAGIVQASAATARRIVMTARKTVES